MGFLTPTFTSVATSGISAVIAARSLEAAALSGSQTLMLMAAVAVGTFLTAKLGKAVGFVGGVLIGAPMTAITGAGLGALATRGSGDGAAAGGMLGGMFGLVAAAGLAVGGYFTGAYAGHHLAKDITLNSMAPHSQPVESPAPAPVLR